MCTIILYKKEDCLVETVAVSKFREKMVHFLAKVHQGESITLTSRGNKVAIIVPVTDKMKASRNALKQLQKTVFIGDVLSPVGEKWEVME